MKERQQLVKRTNSNKWRPNPGIPKCIPGRECEIENYDLAKADNFKGWQIHHRLEEKLSEAFTETDIALVKIGMYFYRPPEELIYLTIEEHQRLHRSFNNYMKGRLGELNHLNGNEIEVQGLLTGAATGDYIDKTTEKWMSVNDDQDDVREEWNRILGK